MNLTVVVFVGVVLSDATTVNTLSPNVVSVATFPDNVCDKGAASVALSLEVAPVSVTPLGNPDVVKFDSFPVLSEALTVISAFSPRYTVTFGTLASGVDSKSVVSWLFCTNLTVGLTVSLTFIVTLTILLDCLCVASGALLLVSCDFGSVTFT